MKTSFVEFATKCKLTNNKLEQRNDDIVPNIFPTYSSNPIGQYYSLHCKFQLLRFKPWKNSLDDAWGATEQDNQTFITFSTLHMPKNMSTTGLKRFQMY